MVDLRGNGPKVQWCPSDFDQSVDNHNQVYFSLKQHLAAERHFPKGCRLVAVKGGDGRLDPSAWIDGKNVDVQKLVLVPPPASQSGQAPTSSDYYSKFASGYDAVLGDKSVYRDGLDGLIGKQQLGGLKLVDHIRAEHCGGAFGSSMTCGKCTRQLRLHWQCSANDDDHARVSLRLFAHAWILQVTYIL